MSELFSELNTLAENNPALISQAMDRLKSVHRANVFVSNYCNSDIERDNFVTQAVDNPLWKYFQNHHEGKGIWKWEHYFEIYHRHLSKFIGKELNVLEIGVYSGGSLDMWHSYFGPQSHVHGVDIEEACKTYENDHTTIHIGDQSDRKFWRTYNQESHGVDALIDDGGHTHEQQCITLEEMLPRLNPGGVYICEDVTGYPNQFSIFASSLIEHLNRSEWIVEETLQSKNTVFQSAIHSIHFYPFMVIIEKQSSPLTHLAAPKKGAEWQPFFD